MSRKRLLSCAAIAAVAVTLAACGKGTDKTTGNTLSSALSAVSGSAGGYKYSAADGYDICLRMVAEKLGPNAKVSSVTGYFSPGKDIDPKGSIADDPDKPAPQGALTQCTVDYQNPQDARKLLRMQMNIHTGQFGTPAPLEIHASDPSHFNLEDYLITLDKVGFAGVKQFMDSQSAITSKKFSKFAWDRITLDEPGTFSNKHTILVNYSGRLASNDIEQNNYARLSVDGKKVLQPPSY